LEEPRSLSHLAAQFYEARTHLAQRRPVIFAEVGDRLVIGRETAQQPHHFDIASGLSFKPAARLHPVQIAVNVELQENRRMIRRPARGRRIDPFKGHLGQIERVDKNVDYTNRIVLADPIFQAFRK